MRKKLRLIFASSILPLLLILHSCTYNSGDIAYYNIEKPSEDSIKVNFSITGFQPTDTLIYSANQVLAYQLSYSSGIIQKFYFVINNDTITPENNQIDISGTNLIKNTVYPLKMNLRISTGTGSLADIKGKEGINIQDKTVLYVKSSSAN